MSCSYTIPEITSKMASNNSSIVTEAVLEDMLADFWPDFPCLYDIRSSDFKKSLDVKTTIDSISLYLLPLIVLVFVAAKELTVKSLHLLTSLNIPVPACLQSRFLYEYTFFLYETSL